MGFGTGRGRSSASAVRSGTRSTATPSGRQHQKLIGPVWTGRGRPPDGYFTKRGAEDWLRDKLLEDAQRADAAPGRCDRRRRSPRRPRSTCASPSRTAAASRRRSAATARSSTPTCCRRSARCGSRTSPSARSSAGAPGCLGLASGREVLSNKTKNHQLVLMHAIFRRAVKLYGLPRNPLANVDRYRVRAQRRHRGLLARGDLEPRARRRIRGRRGDLPDRRVHRPAPRRAARAALARHRLRGLDDPSASELRRRAS